MILSPKFRKTVYVSLTVGFIMALVLWLVVVLNGELEPSAQPGFVAQVSHLQQPGMDLARRWFPCSGNFGCEYFRVLPTTLLINTFFFGGVLLLPIYIFRLFSTSLD